jgi:hypothetical protein
MSSDPQAREPRSSAQAPAAPPAPLAGTPAPPAPVAGSDPAADGGVPVRIRPAVAIVLAAGAVVAVATLYFDPSPTVRYALVGVIAVLYFVTKVKYWL